MKAPPWRLGRAFRSGIRRCSRHPCQLLCPDRGRLTTKSRSFGLEQWPLSVIFEIERLVDF
jgi:hypothetical protein